MEQVGGSEAALAMARQDIWGNVRVPFLHMLGGYDSDDPFAWVDVPADSLAPYESLVGVPIRGIPGMRTGNATMILQSSYMTMSVS